MRVLSLSSQSLVSDSLSSQLERVNLDALQTNFEQEACNFGNLFAMTAASLGSSLVRAGFSSAFRSAGLFCSGAGLVTEVGIYRSIHHLDDWNEKRGFTHDFLSFSCLKSVSFLTGSQGAFVRHASSALAMTTAGYASESVQLSEHSSENFAQRFSHALVASLALEAGGHLSRALHAGKFQRIESRLHAKIHRASIVQEVQTFSPQMAHNTGAGIVATIPLRFQKNHGIEVASIGNKIISHPTLLRERCALLTRKSGKLFLKPLESRMIGKDYINAILSGSTETEIYSQTWMKDSRGEWRLAKNRKAVEIALHEEFALGEVVLRLNTNATGETVLERMSEARVVYPTIPAQAGWIDASCVRVGRTIQLPDIPEALIAHHLQKPESQGERKIDGNIAAETWRSPHHTNEDRFFTYRCPQSGRIILAAIDGMGGHAGGARAAVIVRLSLEWACRHGLNIDEAVELAQRAVVRDNWQIGPQRAKSQLDSALAFHISMGNQVPDEAAFRRERFRKIALSHSGYKYFAGAVICIGEFNPNAKGDYSGRVLSLGDAELHLMAPHLPAHKVLRDWTLQPIPLYDPSTQSQYRQRKRSNESIHREDLILARLHPQANMADAALGFNFKPQIRQLNRIPKGFMVVLSSDGLSENYGHLQEFADVAHRAYQAGARHAEEYMAAFVADSRIRTELTRESMNRRRWTRVKTFPPQTFILSQQAYARAHQSVHGRPAPQNWQGTYQSPSRDNNPFIIRDQIVLRRSDAVAVQGALAGTLPADHLRRVISYHKAFDDQTVIVCVF